MRFRMRDTFAPFGGKNPPRYVFSGHWQRLGVNQVFGKVEKERLPIGERSLKSGFSLNIIVTFGNIM